MAQHKIALVDDDRNILISVKMGLEAAGFHVTTYADGASALQEFRQAVPDIGVFDIKMPRMDGRELLRELRYFSDIPVIFLTSVDDEADQVLGLRIGADDYITKPFSQKLLIERIRTLLRRTDVANAQKNAATYPVEASAAKLNVKKEKLTRGALVLDDAKYLCTWNGRAVDLTVTEYLLVRALAVKRGHVKSRAQLMDEARAGESDMDERTVDSHIKRVRQKFKKIDAAYNEIETVYGIGYKYSEG